MDALSLRQQVGQLVVSGFPGTSAPAWMRGALREQRLGGVILFGYNVRSEAQVKAMNRRFQAAAGGRALIALDQEGGVVRRLPWASPSRGQPQLGTESLAFRTGREGGRDLHRSGANVNLAPVGDVALGSSEMRQRAFPGGAAKVARLTAAAVRGYRGTGVLPTVKHFPGFGAARVNTDDAAVTIRRTRAQMDAVELAPFRAAIAARTPLIMVAHAVYPAYDAKRIASQSPAILTGLLRERLGYAGVVATDSMEARAVLTRSSVGVAAVRSLRAGADLMLLSGQGSYRPVTEALIREARRFPAFRARIRESAARVLTMKAALR